jgi:hypothetical protein
LAQGGDLLLEAGEVELGGHLAFHLLSADLSQVGGDLILFEQLHGYSEIIVIDVFA